MEQHEGGPSNEQDRKPSKRSAKLRGHPRDAEDVRISKTLSWILRHGAKSEGLYMRPDGYVRVQDLVSRHPAACLMHHVS